MLKEKMTDQEIFRERVREDIRRGEPADYNVIFSHQFAKAFFNGCKNKRIDVKPHYFTTKSGQRKLRIAHRKQTVNWQEGLRQMVLEENPLEYLSKFLEEK